MSNKRLCVVVHIPRNPPSLNSVACLPFQDFGEDVEICTLRHPDNDVKFNMNRSPCLIGKTSLNCRYL